MARNNVQKLFKMIVLVSDPGAMKSVFEQLKVRNILVYPIGSVDAAMKVLSSGAVDYCMLSVDNSKLNLDELPQKIENELNIPVIAISELRDKKSMWRLTKVKTKNILYSKANAHNIYQRIELIRNAQQASRAKSAQLLSAVQNEKYEKHREEIRQEIRKESRETAARETNSKLLLLADSKKTEKQVRLLTTPVKQSESLGTVKLTTETKFRSASDPVVLKVAPPAPAEAQKVINGCLEKVLGEFCSSDELAEQTNEFTRSMVISINSKDLVGTFIIATQSMTPKLGDVQTQLYEHLRSEGFDWVQEEIKVELLTDQKMPVELITAGVYVSGVGQEGEVAISYYPQAVKVPELTLTNSSQHLLDPNNLVKNTFLNFDVFIHLKLNSKDLHYIKVGSEINQRQIDSLKSGVLTPFVPRNQLSNLNEYVLLQRLLKLINPDEELDEEIEALLRIS